jgi:hypothetical protein
VVLRGRDTKPDNWEQQRQSIALPVSQGQLEMTYDEKVLQWSVEDPATGDDPENWGHEGDLGDQPSFIKLVEEGQGTKEYDGSIRTNPRDISANDSDTARINFVVNTPSFSWLIASVQRRCQLDYSNADVLDKIRASASSSLRNYKGNRALQPQEIEIRMTWDPRAFIQQ